MKSYKCTYSNTEITTGDLIIEHKVTELYFCSFQCEGNFLIEKYGRSLTSEEFEEHGREEYILEEVHFEE
jgi:ribosomal protein L24E